MAKLDLKKMLNEIDELTMGDDLEDWEWKAAFGGEFSQADAIKMSKLLTRIYMVAHCVHCKPCQIKYMEKS